MKKIFYLLLFIFSSVTLFSQPLLRVANITGAPFSPQDTAYEVSSYDSIKITVYNDSGATFTDTLDILLRTDTMSFDTLYSGNDSDTIQSGDSIIVQRDNYVFSPVFFDDGDNIVVVWPQARHTQIQSDSLTIHLYFISLLATVDNPQNEPVILYPNPSTQYVAFSGAEEMSIKQVRIYTLSGKEIYRNSLLPKFISVADWKPGLYIIEIENTDSSRRVFKLQKN